MKTISILAMAAATLLNSASAFVPSTPLTSFSTTSFTTTVTTTSLSMAKYNTMDEILAKFPDDKPILINFYDASTEAEIKNDVVRAKNLLKDRLSFVSIKQQDYPGESHTSKSVVWWERVCVDVVW